MPRPDISLSMLVDCLDLRFPKNLLLQGIDSHTMGIVQTESPFLFLLLDLFEVRRGFVEQLSRICGIIAQ